MLPLPLLISVCRWNWSGNYEGYLVQKDTPHLISTRVVFPPLFIATRNLAALAAIFFKGILK